MNETETDDKLSRKREHFSMFRYFTIFLCSSRWAHPERILPFLDWLADVVPLRGRLTLIARERVGESRKPSLEGDFYDIRRRLDAQSYESVNVSDQQWGLSGSQIYFHFENNGRPGANSCPQQDKQDINILTVSFRSDIWSACQRTETATRLLGSVENLFGDLDCLYGYGHHTKQIISSRYSLVGGTHARALRIIDFDYTKYIEDVYQRNYLSNQLINRLGPGIAEDLDRLSPAVEWKRLYDSAGVVKGIGIFASRFEVDEIRHLQAVLDPIIWTG